MGRIDEALRRTNFDVSRDTGAVSAAPEASPWAFGPDRHDDGPSRVGPVRSLDSPAAGDRTPEGQRLPLWRTLDARVLERLVVSPTASPLLVEPFRSLAATLLQAQLQQPLTSLVVTSAAPGDGKSHVAVNLALTLADAYRRRVMLIDADLRRPVLHEIFRVSNTRGLGNALRAKTDEAVAVVQLSETLTLVPAGPPEQNPLGGLASDRMKRIINDAASRYDWVIVDAAPAGVLADGRLLSEMVDAAILVVRAGATRFPDLEVAAHAVGLDRILGVVLNAVDAGEIRAQNYYGHYYGQKGSRG